MSCNTVVSPGKKKKYCTNSIFMICMNRICVLHMLYHIYIMYKLIYLYMTCMRPLKINLTFFGI